MQWFVDGKKILTGPRIDLDAMQYGEVVGIVIGAELDGTNGESGEKGEESK